MILVKKKNCDAKFHWWSVLHFDLNARLEIPILVLAAQRPIQPSRLSFWLYQPTLNIAIHLQIYISILMNDLKSNPNCNLVQPQPPSFWLCRPAGNFVIHLQASSTTRNWRIFVSMMVNSCFPNNEEVSFSARSPAQPQFSRNSKTHVGPHLNPPVQLQYETDC